jgi:multicomponent Na+:H+ antiporter subunit F
VSEWLAGFAVFLAANLVAGLLRLFLGPHPADRLLAAQLFGTLGVALLLVLSVLDGRPALRHIGLVFVLLALLATAVFTRLRPHRPEDGAPAP